LAKALKGNRVKKILFVLRKPPHSGAYSHEMLDLIMTVAAFDQEVSVLLLDNAVFQVKKRQDAANTGLKDTAAMFKALPIYNVQTLYVEKESLQERGLTPDQLDGLVSEIPRPTLGEFFKQFDLILPT
jgi:tRNA 2-thiouridine synthesizing protein C